MNLTGLVCSLSSRVFWQRQITMKGRGSEDVFMVYNKIFENINKPFDVKFNFLSICIVNKILDVKLVYKEKKLQQLEFRTIKHQFSKKDLDE